jgi:acetyl-CoA carboxylase biotin carboxylase subunit
VSELITGIDIVKASIQVAAGEHLAIRQDEVKINGHAIEFRINAEDPDRNFMPQAGVMDTFNVPGGLGVRVDTHVRPGYRIPPNYDSMIAKLIVHGRDRNEAIARARCALAEFTAGPGATTLSLHRKLIETPQFQNVNMDIHWVERWLEDEASAS